MSSCRTRERLSVKGGRKKHVGFRGVRKASDSRSGEIAGIRGERCRRKRVGRFEWWGHSSRSQSRAGPGCNHLITFASDARWSGLGIRQRMERGRPGGGNQQKGGKSTVGGTLTSVSCRVKKSSLDGTRHTAHGHVAFVCIELISTESPIVFSFNIQNSLS